MYYKLLLSVCFFVFLPFCAYSYTDLYDTVEKDGVIYRLHYVQDLSGNQVAREASAIGIMEGYSGEIIIPEMISHEIKKNFLQDTYAAEFVVEVISGFSNCKGITAVKIPKTVKEITTRFGGCDNLTSIVVDSDNQFYDSRDNCNCIIATSSNEILAACKTSTIPLSVTSIGDYSFSGISALTSIDIPVSVTSIKSKAFQGCSALQSVELPENVQWVGGYVFQDCSALKTIVMHQHFGTLSTGLFENCNSLTDIYFYAKEPLTLVDNVYFNNQTHVEPVFGELIKDITLHVCDDAIESYKELEPWCNFKDIVPIEIVTDFNLIYFVDGEEYKTEIYKYDDVITPLEEPVKEGYTFSGWSEIPKNMPGKEVKVYGTFVRNEVKENGVVYWALNEKAVVLGNDNASGGVRIVEKVTFNEKELPVTKIMDNALNGCKGVTTIDIPATITSIGERAFAGIDKLTDVTIRAEEIPATDRTAFENSYIEDYVTLHVPAASIDKYKEVAPWKNFKSIITIEGTEPPQTFRLIYMVDGEVYKTVEIKEGAEITPEAEPTKDGFIFCGWSTIPATMPAEDVTITGTFLLATDFDEITIKEIGKTTWCSEYDLDFTNVEGIKAYTATGYNNITKTIWLTRVMEVPAGTGILVKGDAGTYKIPHAEVQSAYANWFVGNLGETISISATDGDKTNYYLSGKDGTFKSVNGSANIGKNKAYLQLPTSVFGGTRSIGICYDDEDGTTSIKDLNPTLSEGEGAWYTLQGQRVAKPGRGIYIRNGKKVLIK